MSSLAATQADGYYVPPNDNGEKAPKKSKTNQYEKHGIVRFELPLDAWCLSCNLFISKGTRFNAKKDMIGKYFTTNLYSFSFNCTKCKSQLEIQTDPENRTYKYSKGLRKHEADLNYISSYDYKKGTNESLYNEYGIIQIMDEETKAKINSDPMLKLQISEIKKKRANELNASVSYLLKDSKQEIKKNDFMYNLKLRNINRGLRKSEEKLQDEGEQVGLSIPLLKYNEEDEKNAINYFKKAKLKAIKNRIMNDSQTSTQSLHKSSTNSILSKRNFSMSISSNTTPSNNFVSPQIKLIKRKKIDETKS